MVCSYSQTISGASRCPPQIVVRYPALAAIRMMTNTVQLQYATGGRRTWSVLSIIALVVGLGSGPATVVLVRLSGIAYGISVVGSGIAVVVGLVAASYCITAIVLARLSRQRGQLLALFGLLATVLWAACLIRLFFYIGTQLN